MNFTLYLFLNINMSILGCYEALHFKFLSFPVLLIFNLHLIFCETYKNLPLFSLTPEKVDVVLLYFGIFTYFPIILINLFVDNSIFHLYVLFHWIYHYLTCPIFQENIPNFPTLSLSCDKQCVICFDNMKSKAVFLPCQHCFHEKCIMKWFKTKKSLSDYTCPLCRRPVYKIIDYDKLESR